MGEEPDCPSTDRKTFIRTGPAGLRPQQPIHGGLPGPGSRGAMGPVSGGVEGADRGGADDSGGP